MLGRTGIVVALLLAMLAVGCEGDTIIQAPPPATPERIEISSGNNLVGIVGTRARDPLVVMVFLSNGAPAENVQVIFDVEQGDAIVEDDVVKSDANGIALTFVVFGTNAGPVEISARANGLQGSPLTFNAMGVAADASILVRVSGDGQTGTVGVQLAQPVVVRAEDMYGNPVADVTVTFSVTAGGGTVGVENVQTATDGTASDTWVLGTVAGTQTVQASAGGLAGFPVAFSATAQPDTPTVVAIASGDNQGGVTGQTLDEPLVVLVTDQYENPVPEVTVDFAVTTGDGNVGPASDTTDNFGKASAILTLGSVGDHEVTASVESISQQVFHARAFSPVTLQPLTKDMTGSLSIGT